MIQYCFRSSLASIAINHLKGSTTRVTILVFRVEWLLTVDGCLNFVVSLEEQKYYGPFAGKKQQEKKNYVLKENNSIISGPVAAIPSTTLSLRRVQSDWYSAVIALLQSKERFRTRGIHWTKLSTKLVDEFLEQSAVTKSDLDQSVLQCLQDQCLASVRKFSGYLIQF